MNGLHLETLPANDADFPKSLRIYQYDIHEEQFAKRAMLSIEHEIVSPLPLYDPQASRESDPLSPRRGKLVNPELSSITIDSFCRAMSLATNNYVDWFIHWWDYGDVEAFFLNPGFSEPSQGDNRPITYPHIRSRYEVLSGNPILASWILQSGFGHR